jgi:hypothetical protein
VTSYPRDLVGDADQPPDRRWPGGARLALNIVVDYQEGWRRSVLHGDKVAETRQNPVDSGSRPRNPPPLGRGGRGCAPAEVMMRLVILSTLGLLVALAGCSISDECGKMGYAPGSSAYQTCVSTILQRRNDISNQINRRQHGSDAG